MWCGASASTRIRETVRHTRRFDLDSSYSFSVVLSSAVWNMSSRKKSVFVLFLFLFLLFIFFAFVPACLTRLFSGALCCLIFFLWWSLFHLASDLARFWVQFRSRFTVHPPTPSSHSHISPNWRAAFTLQTNQFFHLPHLERHSEMRQLEAALKTCRLFVNVPYPPWQDEVRPRFSYLGLCVLLPACIACTVCVTRA